MSANSMSFSVRGIDLNVETLIDHLPCAAGIKDSESVYVAANSQLAQITGFNEPKDLIGLTDIDLKCPAADLHEIFVQQDKETLQGHKQENIDISFYANDKLTIFLSMKNKILDKQAREFVFFTMTKLPILAINHIFNLPQYLRTNDLSGISASYATNFNTVLEKHKSRHKLTPKQGECLFYLLRGRSNKEIAYMMGISIRTVEEHINAIKMSFGCFSKNQIHEKAQSLGLNQVLPLSIIEKLS